MQNLFKYILIHFKRDKLIGIGKLVSVTAISQIGIQAVGFVCGILIIRLLKVEEYALYTLANTMLGTMTVLADSGISAGVMKEGGKVWQDKEKLGVILATGLFLRKKFALISLLVSVPFLIFLLIRNDASILMCILITLSLIPAFYAALSDSLLQITPRLHQDLWPLQKNQLLVSLLRLLCSVIFIFIFPLTFVALMATGISRIYGNYKLRLISEKFVDNDQKPDKEVEKRILRVVRRILPTSIYYTLQGQISIWLISVLGTVTALGELGALGRFGIAFSTVSLFFDMLIVPRFARLNTEHLEKKRFLIYQFLLIVTGLAAILFFFLFKEQLLWILGSDYLNLGDELMFIALSGSLGLLSGTTNTLLSARGIILPPVLLISVALSVQVLCAFLLPLDTLIGVILFSIYTSTSVYLLRIFYFLFYNKFST